MSDTITLNVKILDKEYFISCPKEDEHALQDSAQNLNAKMKEIRDSGKVVGNERIAVMAALNITHEYVQFRSGEDERSQYLMDKIHQLQEKLDASLSQDGG